MALIRRLGFDDFTASLSPAGQVGAIGVQTLAVVDQISRAQRSSSNLVFEKSSERRGMALNALTLSDGFGTFLSKVFKATHRVYFLAWAWDFSGAPITHYPDPDGGIPSSLIPLKGGQTRSFLGSGVVLFPARAVTAGMALRIHLWESAGDERAFGETMKEVAETIQKSELNKLLNLVAVASGVTVATVSAIKEAAIETGILVGKILEKASDDYVDFYEGYYPASEVWTAGEELHRGFASEIKLYRMT